MVETAPTTSKARRSQRSSEAMLRAAGELIVEGGYRAMTLAAVGERAGYSRGLATARFGSKDALLAALVERMTTTWNHRNVLPRTEGRPGAERVLVLLEAIAAQAAKDPRQMRVLYSLIFEALGPIPELRMRFVAFHREMRSDIASMLRAGLRDGSVRSGISPVREAELIVAALRGIAYQWALEPEHFDPVRALRYLADATSDRLEPPRGEP